MPFVPTLTRSAFSFESLRLCAFARAPFFRENRTGTAWQVYPWYCHAIRGLYSFSTYARRSTGNVADGPPRRSSGAGTKSTRIGARLNSNTKFRTTETQRAQRTDPQI